MKSNTRNNDALISFGLHLKKIRESKNISQAKLGLLINSYQSSIQRIEYGQSNPELCMLIAIADALEIKLSELLNFDYDIKSDD
jgi:putative transcriptional regulator